MADNLSAVPDGTNFPDWIEVCNVSAQAADLTGWSLTDDSEPRKFVFPPGTILAGGDCLVVWCDGRTNAPGLHASFALDRSGESVFLYDALTSRVDAVTFGLQLPDFSIGIAGQYNDWQLTQPTPGSPNVAVATAAVTNLVLNEWMANPVAGADDWVELHNRDTDRPAALKGLYLGNGSALCQLQSLSFIGPGGHVLLWADEKSGVDHLDFKLPASGSPLVLYDATGEVINALTNSAQQEGFSSGRYPDGGNAIVNFGERITPGAPNITLAYTGPRLNELMARNATAVHDGAGRFVDWIELYYAGTPPFDLSGFSLSLNENRPGQWVFPPGTTMERYLVVWCDSERPASLAPGPLLNAGRELGDVSGGVYLFDPAGRLADMVEYGFQVQDLALAKITGAWKLAATPTPGATNSLPASMGTPSSLRLNEWMASPLTGDDWFEIYNTQSLPVSLGGVYLTDDPSTAGRTNFAVNRLSFIGPLGWIRWEADGNASQGRHHVNFRLDDQGETLRIYYSTVLVDAVDFGPQSPGVSQGRLPDGSTTIVSFPTTPTPGAMNMADADGDGMPDPWETAYGFNLNDPADADQDTDGDGISNRDEYLSGTDPLDPQSVLRIDATHQAAGWVTLSFTAVAEESYTILYRDTAGDEPWQKLRDVAAPAVTRRLEIIEPVGPDAPSRFYRLVTPTL